MNLIDESYNTKKSNKKIIPILVIGIILVIFIIIALLAYVTTINSNKTKLMADGKEYNYSEYLLNKDNVYYIWIEGLTRITPGNGYNYKSGDIDVEDENKCYITNAYESTFFKVGSNEVYKTLEDEEDVAFYTLDNPVIKEADGKIYMPLSAIDVAGNAILVTENNTFSISSIGYLEGYYNQESSSTFKPDTSIVWETSYSNKKLLKKGLVIIQDSSNNLGLATISSNTETKNKIKTTTISSTPIIAPKYKSIEYVERYDQLIVESENSTKGIIQLSENNGKETIVTPQYEDIKPINEKLFLVSKSIDKNASDKSGTKKYGIVGLEEEEILPMEYNEIGIDISKFSDNDLHNQYIIYDNLIPVKKDKLWGFVNLKGNVVIKLDYDDLGCDSSNSSNNVLIVPELNGIVVKKDGKYGIITNKNLILVKNILTKISKETVDNKEQYSIVRNNKKEDLMEYINSLGSNNKDTSKTTNQDKTTESNTDSNTTNSTNENLNENDEKQKI